MEVKDKQDIHTDPFSVFAEWYAIRENSGKENYNAMALSTAGNDGRVSSRMVLLKRWDKRGFVFFSNYESRKGIQLEQNPYASLLFHWPGQRRQLRIEGLVTKTSRDESDDYFHSRKHSHKINALASPQSREIPDRHFLIDRYEELLDSYRNKKPARPIYWGGYRLKPLLFEFWQEGDNRLHDRTEYALHDSLWHIRRLAP